jgi:hypothetical protein
LDASSYVPLADVDPRIGEYLLDVLWAAGVPAYLEPPTGGAPARAVAAPTSPLDRLWVDRERRGVARSIVEAETPGLPDQGDRSHSPARLIPEDRAAETVRFSADEEAAWQSLVAELEAPSTVGDDPPVHPWPAQEDLAPPSANPGPGGPAAHPSAGRARSDDGDQEDGLLRGRGRARREEPEPPPFDNLLDAIDSIDTTADEGHYEPPLPPPLPRPSRHTWLALALIGAGTLLILVPKVTNGGGPAVFAVGVLLIIAGAGLLIWHLRDDHDDPDGGAVV